MEDTALHRFPVMLMFSGLGSVNPGGLMWPPSTCSRVMMARYMEISPAWSCTESTV